MSGRDESGSRRGYASSGSDSRYGQPESASAARRRKSRAGTRSVDKLSSAQLERKRANDREAQKAIRQRNKDNIEGLERRVHELTAGKEAALQRNRELEEELAFYKGRTPGSELSSSEGHVNSPQARFHGANVPQPPPGATRTNFSALAGQASTARPEAWRSQSRGYPAGSSMPSATMPDLSRAVTGSSQSPGSWRSSDLTSQSSLQLDQQASRSYSNSSDRSQWSTSTSQYGYIVDPAQQQQQQPQHQPQQQQQQPQQHQHHQRQQHQPQQGQYNQSSRQMPLQIQAPGAQYSSMQAIIPSPSQAHAGYANQVVSPHAELQNLSVHSPGANGSSGPQGMGDPQSAHNGYVPSQHLSHAQGYQTQLPQQGVVQREQLNAPAYSVPVTAPGYPSQQQIPIQYQAQPGQHGYPLEAYHSNG